MSNTPLTLFTFGYQGWGNWTDKLVEAVDAVEASRGRGPPMFVDIRASRKVRAEGFREHAFERRMGLGRYRWMNGLGNKAILTDEKDYVLVNPSAASELLELAVEMKAANRRIIYFCSCSSPTDGCHRHWIAPELFKYAEQRQLPVTVVEWPGFESDPETMPHLDFPEAVGRQLAAGRVSIPLGKSFPGPTWCALPWFTPVAFDAGDMYGFILMGPAEHRAGGWQLPRLGGMPPSMKIAKHIQEHRRLAMVLPRTWPPTDGPAADRAEQHERQILAAAPPDFWEQSG